ncbi:MAG: T9SS type A sorting domain-containing protein [Flavobacteriales bacterium]|nr:T9SS type A sorting domain-containing protein [Flavobacteriales bacterium]
MNPVSRPLLLTFGLCATSLFAQDLGDRHVVLQEITIPNMPGLQSFAWGQHNGEWLLIGGRTDGLHRRQPFAAFLAEDNNTVAYVVDPVLQQVWSTPMSSLPAAVYQQLQSTNMEYEQVGNTLYIIGGYGFAALANDHITHPRLTAVDVSEAINAIKNGQEIAPHFRSITDQRMAVTGGYLGTVGDLFHLVGGQRFIGRYNPQGPDFGPGFIQEYTNAIRRFRIADDGANLAITDFTEVVDTLELHRRDYNLVAQIFPDGTPGYTAFSGVFQYEADIPWLNTVDITADAYTAVPDFEQLLNQYHGGHMPVYSTNENRMGTVFFGGIGRYYFNANGQLVDDVNVPFVNTISMVVREGDGSMEEFAIGEMPALMGAGAEFIHNPDIPLISDAIVDLDALVGDTVLAGHIVGGIESSARNIFFVNTGTQSDATARVFRVLLVQDVTTSLDDAEATSREIMTVSAVPGSGEVYITIDLEVGGMVALDLLDSSGRQVRQLLSARIPAGGQRMRVDVQDLAAGAYLVRLQAGELRKVVRFIR